MATKNTISIQKAAKQLAVPESMIREAIKPLYENWETIKSIKLTEFESITEALRDLASEETESEDEDSAVLEESPQRSDEQSPGGSDSRTPAVGNRLDFITNAEINSESSLEKDFPDESSITLAETSDLVSPEAEALKVSVIRTFSDFALDLNQITQALAYSTALKNFSNFKEIHSATFRHHAEQYVEDFGQEYERMLSDLEEKCDPKAFLQQRGITTASTTV